MTDEQSEMQSVGEIEGYEVFYVGASQDVGEETEPVDIKHKSSGKLKTLDKNVPPVVERRQKPTAVLPKTKHSIQGQAASKSSPIGNKSPHFGKIVDNLLKKNDVILAKHDLTPYKPRYRQVFDRPCDTETPPLEEVHNSQNALVEVDLTPGGKNKLNPDVLCAVASNMNLTNSEGHVVSIDTILYWCNFCCYRSDKIHELYEHVNSHRFCCQSCSFQSFSRSALLQHQLDEHGAKEGASLKLCAFISDVCNNQNTGKRKHSDDSFSEADAKRKFIDEDVPIDYSVTKGSADCNKNQMEVINELKDMHESAVFRSKPIEEFRNIASGTPNIATGSSILYPNVKIEPNESKYIQDDLKITDVISGQDAINDLFQCSTQATSQKLTRSEIGSKLGITDLANIALKCSFCNFTTFNENFLTLHMNAEHARSKHTFDHFLVSRSQRKEILESDKDFFRSQAFVSVITRV